MIKSLFAGLFTEQPERLPETDARLALAVILVRIARIDDDYVGRERQHIDKILQSRFGLKPEQSAQLRQEAEELEITVADNVSFTRTLKEAVPFEGRVGLVESLWEIVLADGNRDNTEDSFLRLASKLLGVNDRDSALARQRVIKRMK